MTRRPFNPEHVTYAAYTDQENTPLYPFGYGLSYTQFKYVPPRISSAQMRMGQNLQVKVQVTNTGKVEGREVVQLYIRDVVASTTRPVKELKVFKLVDLALGQSR